MACILHACMCAPSCGLTQQARRPSRRNLNDKKNRALENQAKTKAPATAVTPTTTAAPVPAAPPVHPALNTPQPLTLNAPNVLWALELRPSFYGWYDGSTAHDAVVAMANWLDPAVTMDELREGLLWEVRLTKPAPDLLWTLAALVDLDCRCIDTSDVCIDLCGSTFRNLRKDGRPIWQGCGDDMPVNRLEMPGTPPFVLAPILVT